MASQTDNRRKPRASSKPPDLGWPARPQRNTERLVGGAVVGLLVASVAVALLIGSGSTPKGAPAPVVSPASTDGTGGPGPNPPPPTTATGTTTATTAADEAALTRWRADVATVRGRLGDSGTLVRRHVAARDGVSLQPECGRLTGLVNEARALPAAPVPTTARSWSETIGHYAAAATACGQLFDGTAIEVDVLLTRTTSALDDAERTLAALDAS